MAQDLKYYGGVLATTGTPAAASGLNGDYALDLTTAGGPFIYYKTGGAWTGPTTLKGAAGTPANLDNIITKTAAYTVTAADLAGNTPVFLLNAATANVPLTIDAALLYNGVPTIPTSLIIGVLRIDASTTYSASIVAGGSSETINGTTSFALPFQYTYREVFAANATTLYTR
jgi:hypothetical protein